MANERYAAFDGREAAAIVLPDEHSAVVVAKQRRSPFFWVEQLGDQIISHVLRFLSLLFRYLFAAAVVCFKGARYLLRKLAAAFRAATHSLSEDARGMRRDLSMLREGARRNEQNRGAVLLRAYWKYILQSFRRRRGFWQTLGNIALPLLAAVVVVAVAGRYKFTTAALEVRLNDAVVGYAADETVVRRAMAELREILPQDNRELRTLLGDLPSYQLRRVPLTALSGSEQLCETMLREAKTPLAPACGIFIDGAFLCAVHNESDAVSAFNSLIAAAREKAEAKGRLAAFVEEIDYVQGLYPDDPDTLWDPIVLKKALRAPKSEAQYLKVRSKDTLAKIKKRSGVSAATLRALNAAVDFDHLQAGTQLLIAPQTDYVRIKEMQLIKFKSVVPFETVRRESDSLRAGTTKLLQEGKNGMQETTEMIAYIDGRQISDSVVSVQQTVAPVQQILLVGTGSPFQVFGEAGGKNASGFIWPAVGAYALSSGFGYRSARISGRSFHGGVDIVKPGGHSTGAPVIAAAAGRVVIAQNGYRGYGHTVVIDHGNGLQTRYAHMYPGSITVRVGQSVTQGQQLGKIGSTGNVTGPHLHFEVLKNGAKVNPMNYIG